MNVEKIDEDLYYYTDILTQEEQEVVLNTIKNEENWKKIYDQEDKTNQEEFDPYASYMNAYRKNFNTTDNLDFINIIDKGFKLATNHYKQEKHINDEGGFPPFIHFAHVDKHLPGTTYATHIDTASANSDSYTVLFYLNDEYVGGELSFSNLESDTVITDGTVITDYQKTPSGRYHPDHEINSGIVSHWIKAKACSIVIFPPLKPYPHTAHEIKSGAKYLIKGFWEIREKIINY